jgi:hypothetical protein
MENSSLGPQDAAGGNTDRSALRAGGVAVIIAGLAGVAWVVLELVPPVLGFDDTDDPAVSLDYLRQYPQFYALIAIVAFIEAIAFVVASFAVSDALAPRTSSLTRRSLSALGLISAGLIFMHGVLRESVGPMLYIESIKPEWGESAYVSTQMLGTHGFAAGSLILLGVWAVGISVAGAHSRALPIWLCVLGVVAGLRLVILLAGPFLNAAKADLPDFVWVGSVALIPLGMLWWLCLGVVLLVRSRRA